MTFLLLLLAGAAFAKEPALTYPPLEFTVPHATRTVLSSGATAFLAEDREFPLVYLSGSIRGGAQLEPADRIGLAAIYSTLLRSGGTRTRTPDEVEDFLDAHGISLEFGASQEVITFSLSALTTEFDRGLNILGEILTSPRFDGARLSVSKSQHLEGILRRNDYPGAIARREIRAALYGIAHPYGWYPETDTLKPISRSDLREFHKMLIFPDRMMVAMAGDLSIADMTAKLEKIFRGMRRSPGPIPVITPVRPEPPPRTIVAPKSLTQTTIILGHLGVTRHEPDHFALEILNQIWGSGGWTSRLFAEVRSKRGLAYAIGSTISEPADRGLIAVYTETKSSTTAETLAAVEDITKRMREAPPGADEMATAKSFLINSFIFNYRSANAVATQRRDEAFYGYPADWLDRYRARIDAVTADDVLAAARKHLRPEAATLVLVGDERKFDKPPESFGRPVTRLTLTPSP